MECELVKPASHIVSLSSNEWKGYFIARNYTIPSMDINNNYLSRWSVINPSFISTLKQVLLSLKPLTRA
jgi:hypothetical protein